ncbi:BNR/Asp-box repeat family protein [Hibiscus syriacus]|uniref:BNR/Asp-box repeat family protein n=1 Tax=Hibiscus syriacus TaxID=106335 RepID=A0A6A2WEY6_HIBSY|nr:BNR/Asp-box repeat family protein [Hibiscus syriacus]
MRTASRIGVPGMINLVTTATVRGSSSLPIIITSTIIMIIITTTKKIMKDTPMPTTELNSPINNVYIWKKKSTESDSKLKELQVSLNSALEKCAAERQGRIRAQQALRKAVVAQAETKSENSDTTSYPMAPIGVVQSCFSTRNGSPWQPLLVPLAKACLVLDSTRVPPASPMLHGDGRGRAFQVPEMSLARSHFVFHDSDGVSLEVMAVLEPWVRAGRATVQDIRDQAQYDGEMSTCKLQPIDQMSESFPDLEKLWKHPSKSKFKAKVRVPRLKGGRRGLFATRSPHRPCPIGLTVVKVYSNLQMCYCCYSLFTYDHPLVDIWVNKVETVQGNVLLLSGVDLVDGTLVLDIKPYLPYCDSIERAVVPNWVTVDSMLSVASVSFSDDLASSLENCWLSAEKNSLYSSLDELKSLVNRVLSWDIRSVSQRNRPHNNLLKIGTAEASNSTLDLDDSQDRQVADSEELMYHLVLDGMDFYYEIDGNGNVIVKEVRRSSSVSFGNEKRCNYSMWKDKLE